MESDAGSPRIGVVGPCGSGKSTLIRGLERRGYRCSHIAQEHSYVGKMWQVIARPQVLIYLHVSFENATRRRSLDWFPSDYQEQLDRLAHARDHADLRIDTDGRTVEEVLDQALQFLAARASRR